MAMFSFESLDSREENTFLVYLGLNVAKHNFGLMAGAKVIKHSLGDIITLQSVFGFII